MKTVADQFAETLAAAGVKRIYGIVGDSLNGLTDSLRRQGKIEWVHVRHEEVGGLRGRRRGASDRRARRLRRQLRARQSAPHQRPVRLPPLAGAGARHRGANTVGRDRRRLFPGNPPADAVPGVQPLLRADFRRQPDAAHVGGRDPPGRGQTRRVGRGDPGRHRPAAGVERAGAEDRGPAAARAGRDAGARGSRPAGGSAERQAPRDRPVRLGMPGRP